MSAATNRRLRVVALGAAAAVAGCGGGGGGGSAAASDPPPATTPPPEPDPDPAPKQFVDATAGSGIDFAIGFVSPPLEREVALSANGGVAAGDYDQDGDVDLFVTRGDIGPNLLYRNDGTAVFTDVAAEAGLAYTATADENYRHGGPAFGDVDGDGDLDLFIGGMHGDPSFIYRNEGAAGDYRFTDATPGSGIDTLDRRHNFSASFGDYDLDGDLDLFVTHWGTFLNHDDPGDTQHLWRNDSAGGDIRFTSVSVESEISPSIINLPDPLHIRKGADYTFAASFVRLDDDLYPDIVVASDFNTSKVFLNRGDGTFENVTDVDVIIDNAGMGSAVGDYDNDGDLDWFVSSIGWRDPAGGNRLYRNTGTASSEIFEDVSEIAGIRMGGWGWGSCFIDFENDGDLDIYHTNGWSGSDYPNDDRSLAFVSDGAGGFADRAAELGLDDREDGRGIVCADLDRDGDTDILQLHRGFPLSATLWRNETVGNNSVTIRLRGRAPNTEAGNARIYATIGSGTQLREIILGNNYVSQNPTEQVIGLGTASQVDTLRIEWPDGSETSLGPVAAGETLEIFQDP